MTGAIEVLAESGYQGASLAAIAEHIGVSKGVLSYHFAGKDDLLQQVMRTVLERAGQFMAARVASAGTNLDALRTYVRSNLEFLDSNRAAVHALVEILTHVRAEDGVSPLYAGANTEAVEQLRMLLQRGQQAKEFGLSRHECGLKRLSVRADGEARSVRGSSGSQGGRSAGPRPGSGADRPGGAAGRR